MLLFNQVSPILNFFILIDNFGSWKWQSQFCPVVSINILVFVTVMTNWGLKLGFKKYDYWTHSASPADLAPLLHISRLINDKLSTLILAQIWGLTMWDCLKIGMWQECMISYGLRECCYLWSRSSVVFVSKSWKSALRASQRQALDLCTVTCFLRHLKCFILWARFSPGGGSFSL